MGRLFWQLRPRMARVAGEFGLTPPQLFALKTLDPDNPVPMSTLASALHCDNSNVTGLVDGLESQGLVELEVSDGGTRLDELFDEGLRVEGAAWKVAHGTAIASDAATLSFYRSVARWAADAGILRLAFLRADGRPLAFDFCLEQDGSHYLLKTGFDPGARALAPGIMIRWEMIARAFSEGLASYEFLGKDDAWKLRWTATTRVLLAARAFPPSMPGSVSRLWWTEGRPLARKVLRRA